MEAESEPHRRVEETSPGAEDRPSSQAAFWDERYAREPSLFGLRPNAFIEAQATRIPPGSDVLELGAGEGRNVLFLARQGHRVTLVDFSAAALAKATEQAGAAGPEIEIQTVQADVTTWTPPRRWDAVVVAFLQLLPAQRPRLYALMRRVLRPGGVALGVLFRPAHVLNGYPAGPPTLDRMVSADELRRAFGEGLVLCEEVTTTLDEGPHLQGPAAVVRFVYEVPA